MTTGEHVSGGRLFKGVMVSGTFKDIRPHREALIEILKGRGLHPIAMEDDASKADVDVIDSSLRMVSEAFGYVAIIGCSYGQIVECPRRNPDSLSLTELEFNLARRLGKPILLFLMGRDHDVKQDHVETDPIRIAKLQAFRESAKRFADDSTVHRVYTVFESLQDFERAAAQSVAGLEDVIEKTHDRPPDPLRLRATPPPPQFHAEPPYIGSHEFVGREAQLALLSEWASAADPAPILLFDAIGGTGKSMLTWEWITKVSGNVRRDWAGRFWFSFYEKGATMADFCRRALSYMTELPYEDFRKMKISDLGERLIEQLRRRPWLLVLDGFERVLVAYHRHDAAQLSDEDAGVAIDRIAHRHSCDAIRDEDDELLRRLAAASPSKLLVTSRLLPRALLNRSGSPIRGVRHEVLPGLEPEAAEALIRSCGVEGSSPTIRRYLQKHCDNHPLVIGIVAGLVNYSLRHRRDFDSWAADRYAGGHLDLGELDLVQKRNHILQAAMEDLPDAGRDLLSTLALLSESVDYETLVALNPHMPPQPKYEAPDWDFSIPVEKRIALSRESEKAHAGAVDAWRRSPDVLNAPQRLEETVRDLESRGLLQYDAQSKRYDLHPVVRGVAVGRLPDNEKARHGGRVIDLFSQKAHDPYKDAETLEDVRIGLRLMQTMLQIGRYSGAYGVYAGDLSNALFFNLEAFAEVLAVLRPFFHNGWGDWPHVVDEDSAAELANDAAYALSATGACAEAIQAYEALLRAEPKLHNWRKAWIYLVGIAAAQEQENRLALRSRTLAAAREIAHVATSKRDGVFATHVHSFGHLALLGRWDEADAMWIALKRMRGESWPRTSYRPGTAELRYARAQFWRDRLREDDLVLATDVATRAKTRVVVRELHALRGEWRISTGHWELAAESLFQAVRMAREMGRADDTAEVYLALAKFYLGRLSDPAGLAEQLSSTRDPAAQLPVARLWRSIGDPGRAAVHARAAYEWAWADGEPYVRRYALTEAKKLLHSIGANVPDLAPYSSENQREMSWEPLVARAVAALRVKPGLRSPRS